DGDVAGGEAVDGAGATGPGDVSGADGDEATDGGADGSSSDPTAGPVLRAGGEVIVGSNALLEALNPHSDPNNEPYVSGHVLPTLIAVEGDFSLVPAVAAELPEVVSTDPFTVRWVLRDDATWDDGTPITWRDVDATWRYIVDPESAAVSTYLYDQITGLDPISDTEFTLSFAQPIGVFRVMFSTNHPLIKATAYQEHLDGGGSSADFLQDGLIPFSGGPYRTVGFEPGERVSLRRNDLYWGEPATLERVNIRRYDSIDDQIAAVGSGDIDVMWVELPAATEVIRARGLEGVTVTTGPSDFSFELHFNTRVAPLDEVAVRRAIAHAVDRQAIVDVLVQTATGEPAVPLQSLVHLPRQSAYSAPFAGYGDRASAERLLDEAGWTFSSPDDEVRTRDGVPLTLRLLYRDTTVDRLNGEGLAQILRDQLRRVGIDLELEGVGTSFTSLRAMGDFDLALDFNFVNSDPAAVGLRYATDACPPTVEGCDGEPVGANFDGYSNTEVDGLIAEAGSTQDAAARTALFVEIDGLLAGDVPALPLYEGPSFVAHIDDLVNVDLSASRGGPLARLDEWAYVALLD
ncbi:MAG: peptide ABC transporter substrate-binding protein, partial [Acidimicrobiales bacterium]